MFILKTENAKKAGHNVKPRLPGKTCTLTSVVQIAESACHRSNNAKKKDLYTIRPSGLVGVFIQRTGFVFYRTLLVSLLFSYAVVIQWFVSDTDPRNIWVTLNIEHCN